MRRRTFRGESGGKSDNSGGSFCGLAAISQEWRESRYRSTGFTKEMKKKSRAIVRPGVSHDRQGKENRAAIER